MPSSSPPAHWLVILAFALVYLVWGSTYLAISFAVQTLPPYLMSSIRFLLAGGLVMAWSLGRGAPLPTRTHWRSAIIAGTLLFGLNNSLLVGAEHAGMPSGVAALLIATTPMWFVLLSWMRSGERPSINVFAGLALGTFGLILLVNPGSAGGVDPIGALMVIGAAFCWSVGSLYARDATFPSNLLLWTGMQLVVGGVLQLSLSIVTGELAAFDPSKVTALSVASMIYLGIMSSIITFTAFSWLMRVTSPARVATYAYVNPVVAVFLGWALNNEPLHVHTLIAAAIIVFAVIVLTRAKGRTAKPQATLVETQELAQSVEAA
jgi:drug/metabolite transporter (DMT)-like permease